MTLSSKHRKLIVILLDDMTLAKTLGTSQRMTKTEDVVLKK